LISGKDSFYFLFTDTSGQEKNFLEEFKTASDIYGNESEV